MIGFNKPINNLFHDQGQIIDMILDAVTDEMVRKNKAGCTDENGYIAIDENTVVLGKGKTYLIKSASTMYHEDVTDFNEGLIRNELYKVFYY